MELSLVATNTPNESTDADLNAISTSMQNTLPNIHLLKARILFDGGKYRKALEILEDDIKIKILTKHEQAEYYYRLGRTYHLLELYEKACNNYKTVINISKILAYFSKALYHLAAYMSRWKNTRKPKITLIYVYHLKLTHINAALILKQNCLQPSNKTRKPKLYTYS